MSTITNEALLEQLNWRYATKKFDASRTIPADTWATLEQALLLTPSSFGLQPWKFVVVTDQATKEKLVPVSWNQRQVADASHVVVFAVAANLDAAHVDRYIKRIAEVQGVSEASLAQFREMMIAFLTRGFEWSARQAYIALGEFMTAAALVGVDTCPMEGVEPAKYDEILGLDKEGYRTVVVCPAGYRAADDAHAKRPKVRFPLDEVLRKVG